MAILWARLSLATLIQAMKMIPFYTLLDTLSYIKWYNDGESTVDHESGDHRRSRRCITANCLHGSGSREPSYYPTYSNKILAWMDYRLQNHQSNRLSKTVIIARPRGSFWLTHACDKARAPKYVLVLRIASGCKYFRPQTFIEIMLNHSQRQRRTVRYHYSIALVILRSNCLIHELSWSPQ